MRRDKNNKVTKERIELMICLLDDNMPSFLFNMTKHRTIAEMDKFKIIKRGERGNKGI